MRLSLFNRLTFGYAAILMLLIFLGGYVTLQLHQLNRLSLSITEIDNTTVGLSENITDTLITQESFEKKYLISRDPDFHRHFWNIGDYIEKDLKRLGPLLSAPSQTALWAAINASYIRYQALFREEHEFIENSRRYDHTTFQTSKEKALEGIHQNIKKIITAARASRDRKLADSHRITTHISNVTALTAVLAIIAGVLISFLTTRSITRPLRRLQEQVRAIADGRFEMIPDTAGPPEIKALADDFNVMCRIHVIPIKLPPLTDRKEDIPLLARHFLARFAQKMGKTFQGFTPEAMQKLLAYGWPGNIRELENTVECAVAMGSGEMITPDMLLQTRDTQNPGLAPLREAKDTFEKDYLIQLIEITRGNISQAAKLAGKYRADFYALLKKHQLDPTDFRPE